MKRIKVKVKELPQELKGRDICHTEYKDYANKVKIYGEYQAFYRFANWGFCGYCVAVYKYCNEQYFMVTENGKIKICIWI